MSNKKKEFFLVRWFKRCFLGDRPELSDEEEERIQTPVRAMVANFVHRPLAMIGLIVFLAIFVFVMVGPHIWVLDLSEQDSTLTNLPPSRNMMEVPKALLANGVKDISSGNTYGIGIDNEGELYTWGHTRITDKIDVADIPDEVRSADLVQIAAGTDHVVAVDADGEVYVWGNTRLQQNKFSNDMKKAMKAGGDDWNVIQLEASNQFSAIVCSDGNLYLWGNGNMADIKIRSKYQGKIAKVALTDNEYIALLTDGTVAYTGNKDKTSPFAKIPAGLKGKTVVDIASTSKSVAAITEDGEVYVWGNAVKGEANVPELSAKIVHIYGGRYHYTALLENGDLVSWGNNKYGQIDVPAKAQDAKNIDKIFVSSYQNYALASDGTMYTWGLKGFVLGTDNLGRDMLTRIVNGGQVTMTVGAISVVIATILGIIFGGVAGYFGGNVDILIMRIAEIVGGLPFIPFAMILSAVIGTKLDPTQRMYLIMVVLGVLQLGADLPPRARADSRAARDGIRHGGEGDGHPRAHDRVPPHPAQRRQPADRLHDAGFRHLHADRIHAVLPRLRHSAADPDVGQPAQRREQLHRHPAVLVAVGVPGRDFRHLHHLHQPDRRRSARRARPEGARTIRRRGRIYGTA